MKKTICAILAVMLVLTGCQAAGGETGPATEPTLAPVTETPPQETAAPTLPESSFAPGIGDPKGEELPFENPGKVRLQYTGNRGFVRYVTSVDQLPDEGNWEGYDAAYFENKALLIVVETLNSGSVAVDLETILRDGDTATVYLKRTMAGEVGTSDMATWMLWAEVSREYDCRWTLANATQTPAGELY